MEIQATCIGKTGLLFQGHGHRHMNHVRLWSFWGNLSLCQPFDASPVQLQYKIPSALVTGDAEQILPLHVYCQDPPSKIPETIVRGNPRSSSNSRTFHCRFSLLATRTLSKFWGVLLFKGLPERGSFTTDSQPFLKRRYHNFNSASLIGSSPKAFLFVRIFSAEECPSL